MKTTVILYSKQPQSSFISSTLFTDFLHTLKVGKNTYQEIMEGLNCLAGSTWIYAQTECPNAQDQILTQALALLKAQGVHMEPQDKVLIHDLTFYPLNCEWFEHLLARAVQTDIPLWIYKSRQQNKRFASVCLTYEQLQNGGDDSEVAVIDANSAQLADLKNTETVLRLFSSGFSLRYFNSLQTSRDVFFFKQSDKTEKMQAEYAFFKNLPAPIRPYFPHVGDLEKRGEQTGYEIEVIPCLDVAKSLFNGVFSNDARCSSLVKHIATYLNACPRQKVTPQAYQACARTHFVDKVRQRTQSTLQLDVIDKMNTVCQLNGFASLADFSEAYIQQVEADIASHNESELVFSHGDLFYSNILFDPIKQYIKLIDPKGMPVNQEEAVYMPAWYDLAKLSHSFLGHYDLMVYDLVDVVMQPDMTLGLKSASVPGLDLLQKYFLQFLASNRIDIQRVRLYEGTLFLSMLPLHADDPLRMQRQLIRAMELYRFAQKTSQKER